MRHVKLLDCTLRDGGYLVDKTFGDKVIQGMINGLTLANIDIVEIGFLQNEGQGEGKTVYKNSLDAEKFLKEKRKNCLYTVLADYSRYSIDNLDSYTGKSFDAIRACFFKHESKEMLAFCKGIKEKGYKLFVQPVDILGYSDRELLDLIDDINEIEPYCFSIVDTFGSMYMDDMTRIFNLVHHNLATGVKVGFHSHNNMQMSSALSQEFIHVSHGKREVVVDATISGMGRGAGNTPTELVAQYLVTKWGYNYDMDAILDVIDQYMPSIRSKCTWGYSTPYFIAGSYGAHVNNISFLKQKNSISSKDIRFILNKIGGERRKRYNYNFLEETYTEYLKSDIDDTNTIQALRKVLKNKNIVIIAPGASAGETDLISEYIKSKDAVVIAINFIPENVKSDYLYLNNVKRFSILKQEETFMRVKKIYTSNIFIENEKDNYVVNFSRLIKCGWEHMDNSTIMLLRLLDDLEVKSVGIAGLDGYEKNKKNYILEDMIQDQEMDTQRLNGEIEDMLHDFLENRKNQFRISCITTSRFNKIFEKEGFYED